MGFKNCPLGLGGIVKRVEKHRMPGRLIAGIQLNRAQKPGARFVCPPFIVPYVTKVVPGHGEIRRCGYRPLAGARCIRQLTQRVPGQAKIGPGFRCGGIRGNGASGGVCSLGATPQRLQNAGEGGQHRLTVGLEGKRIVQSRLRLGVAMQAGQCDTAVGEGLKPAWLQPRGGSVGFRGSGEISGVHQCGRQAHVQVGPGRRCLDCPAKRLRGPGRIASPCVDISQQMMCVRTGGIRAEDFVTEVLRLRQSSPLKETDGLIKLVPMRCPVGHGGWNECLIDGRARRNGSLLKDSGRVCTRQCRPRGRHPIIPRCRAAGKCPGWRSAFRTEQQLHGHR